MIRGLINGADELVASALSVRIASVRREERRYRTAIVLEGFKGEEVKWRKEVEDMEPDFTSDRTRTREVDYRAIAWEKRSAVVIAGSERAVVLDQLSGRVLEDLELPDLLMTSLDLLFLGLVRDGWSLVVGSAKRLLVVDSDGTKRIDYRPEGIFTRLEIKTDAFGSAYIWSEENDHGTADPYPRVVIKEHRP